MIPRTADVVVIGAGVVGASVAHHLAARGCRPVVLDAGPGSTPRATGGFRAQFPTAINVRLSLLSRGKLRHFADEVGGDPGYRPCGYLFVARGAAELEALRAAMRVQHESGLGESREVAPSEIPSINPAVAGTFAGGAFCPTDGFIRPVQILEGYLASAIRRGATVIRDAACTAIRVAGSGLDVVTSRGTLSAGAVVNAAGAWAGRVARLAGLHLPVAPLRRQVASTVPTSALPEDMPMTIFTEDGFHLRVRDGRVLLLRPADLPAADPFSTEFDEGWLAGIAERTRARIPALKDVPIDRAQCWAGLYEMSPDRHAILGPAPGLENLHLVNGSSGHGVMHAPALGQLAAERILDGRFTSLDVSELRPSRFTEGRPVESVEFL